MSVRYTISVACFPSLEPGRRFPVKVHRLVCSMFRSRSKPKPPPPFPSTLTCGVKCMIFLVVTGVGSPTSCRGPKLSVNRGRYIERTASSSFSSRTIFDPSVSRGFGATPVLDLPLWAAAPSLDVDCEGTASNLIVSLTHSGSSRLTHTDALDNRQSFDCAKLKSMYKMPAWSAEPNTPHFVFECRNRQSILTWPSFCEHRLTLARWSKELKVEPYRRANRAAGRRVD